MKYVLMATDMSCVGDLTTCCSDYGIAYYLFIIKKVLEIIHIVVPTILVIMVTIDLVKLVGSPDDPQKKKSKALINKFIAAVLVFFIPFIVNLLFNLIDGFGVEISGCWKAAEEIVNVIENTEEYDADLGEEMEDISYKKISTGSRNNTGNSYLGVKMVEYAKRFLGNKYVYGGTSLTNGVDCSGFTMRIYEHFGIAIPRTAGAQQSSPNGTSVPSINEAKPGDLLFYKNKSGQIGHVTMYMGNGKVIHASSSTTGIITSDVNYRQWSSIKRFI